MRFEKKDDHYLDTETGLKWALDNSGPLTWYKAMKQFPQNSEWRLPTVRELLTLVNYKLTDPVTELPDMKSSDYWTSTADISDADYAWLSYFYYGSVNRDYKGFSRYVRAVRGKIE